MLLLSNHDDSNVNKGRRGKHQKENDGTTQSQVSYLKRENKRVCVNKNAADSEFKGKAQLFIRTALQGGRKGCSPVRAQPSSLTRQQFSIFFLGGRLSIHFENCLSSPGE